jgi:hypothetical protein
VLIKTNRLLAFAHIAIGRVQLLWPPTAAINSASSAESLRQRLEVLLAALGVRLHRRFSGLPRSRANLSTVEQRQQAAEYSATDT